MKSRRLLIPRTAKFAIHPGHSCLLNYHKSLQIRLQMVDLLLFLQSHRRHQRLSLYSKDLKQIAPTHPTEAKKQTFVRASTQTGNLLLVMAVRSRHATRPRRMQEKCLQQHQTSHHSQIWRSRLRTVATWRPMLGIRQEATLIRGHPH